MWFLNGGGYVLKWEGSKLFLRSMSQLSLQNLSWDEYFMGIAVFTSFRSKDPSSKVGAVIVDKTKHIVGTGYNGFVAGVDESVFSWEREGDFLDTKYPFVIHAEANAIVSSPQSNLDGCSVYVTLFPCNECAKLLAQKNVSTVYYLLDKYPDTDQHKASERILNARGIKTVQLEMRNLNEILSDFKRFYPENIT